MTNPIRSPKPNPRIGVAPRPGSLSSSSPDPRARRRLLFPLAAFFLPLFLYLLTLAPTVTFEDSGEFLTAAYFLGVPHPPGYPLWCLIAHLFTLLPIGSIPQRVHAFSAVCGAGTCLAAYFVCFRLTNDRWVSMGSAWILAASRYLWSQSVIAEVYSLNALFTAVALCAALEWSRSKRPRHLFTLALTLGLGAANHYLFLLTAPPLVLWAVAADWRTALKPTRLLVVLLLIGLGLSTYLYLPLRAKANPPINSGNPVDFESVKAHILRTAYSTGEESSRLGGTLADGGRHAAAALYGHTQSLGWIVCAMALVGLWRLFAVGRPYALVSLAMVLLNDVVLNLAQRERFNAPWAFTHRVYHIPADVVLVTWFAVALAWIASTIRSIRPADHPNLAAAFFERLAAPILAAILLYFNAPFASRHGDRSADAIGREFLAGLPRNADVTAFDDFIFVILYLTKVERFRPDVQVYSKSMGYVERASGGLYSFVPWSEAAERSLKLGQPLKTVPMGMAYRIVLDRTPDIGLADFATLPAPPTLIPKPADPDDIHAHFARSMLANYYARYGAKLYLLGQKEEAARQFARALDQASTAYACYTIAEIYRQLGIEPDKRRLLLDSSLRLFDRYYDPTTEKMIPLTRQRILDAQKNP